MNKLTLGSLFDGSGGFPLGAVLTGIEPLWASEVEPFPIRVTTKRFPNVIHLGDINKINGAKIPPVDIITAGFCCQDLSVAGKRAGLQGERSGLFYQIPRIIKEMRAVTDNAYPKFAVLENVPGMYSSAGGADFLEVLNELIHSKDEALSVHMPENGKWSTSGEIVGDGFSIGWRTLDAQFWGVAQRRRRCYIVVDFTSERAGEILFDESRLRGNPPSGGFPWEATAGNPAAGSGSANRRGTTIAFEPGAASRIGGHCWDDCVGTLRHHAGDNQTAVIYDARGNGDGVVANTITGDHNGHISDYTSLAVEPKTLKIRSGCDGGGKGALIQNNKSATLSTSNDQTVFVAKPAAFMGGQGAEARSIAYHEEVTPTLRSQAGGNSVPMAVYGICSKSSNSMKSGNPHSGIYEAETSRTLDTSVPDPNKNAGGMAVVALEGNGSRPSHRGDGYGGEVSFTLNSVERHGISYGIDRAAFNQGKNAQYKPQFTEEGATTLTAKGPSAVCTNYIVRRLIPQECALLQGFPPDWCANLETSEPSEADIAWWSEVFETHRKIMGTSAKPKSRNQIIKWLKAPHSDAAEYKMWGNGVALPCVVFVLGGIASAIR